MLTRLEILSFHIAELIIAGILLLPLASEIYTPVLQATLSVKIDSGEDIMQRLNLVYIITAAIYLGLVMASICVMALMTGSHHIKLWKKSDVHAPSLFILIGHLSLIAILITINHTYQPNYILPMLFKILLNISPFVILGGTMYAIGIVKIISRISNARQRLRNEATA